MSEAIKALVGEQYISLTTFRKNGERKPTPVWFAENGGKLYVTTQASAWKVKRIRNNPRVEFAPCDARGNVRGDTFAGTATIHDRESETGKHANRVLNLKYGWQKAIFDFLGLFRRSSYVFLEIEPD